MSYFRMIADVSIFKNPFIFQCFSRLYIFAGFPDDIGYDIKSICLNLCGISRKFDATFNFHIGVLKVTCFEKVIKVA